ncbi:MAG: 3-oxoacyl-[acyl-carrier-protein] reductase FabG [Candidatus Anoxychlamydiales bacterium]|nr:3-oxoacyl-[acyl-carrier-protein] reductase FabG [Candidatus Anoxychlamydiales bacterium]
MLLKNKNAIITGASSGIGKQIAKVFIQNGANVAIIATSMERLSQAKKELEDIKKDPNQKIILKDIDVSAYKDVEEKFNEILKEFVHIDILVNNAGITRDNLLLRMKEEDFDRVIAVNLKSIYNTCKVIIRPMMKARKGKIISISSVIGQIGNAGQTNYAASKAGILGFTKSLAKEIGSRNICVNAIAPGFIETKMTDELDENLKKQMLQNLPLNRLGKTKDVADLALFLASDMSDYITGQVINVDGGMVT